METNENTTTPEGRPLGFWLRVVDGMLTREFAAALADDGIDRRDWMLLNAVAGTVDVPERVREKLTRGGRRLRALQERGWVDEEQGELVLTDAGRAAFERLGAKVAGIRARVADAVGPDAYATTTASLEAIARELGWDEELRMPRGRGFGHRFGGRGFGPGRGVGFGHGRGHVPGFGPGFGPGHHPHPGHRGHGCGEAAGRHEETFERGFEAGFAAARRAEA